MPLQATSGAASYDAFGGGVAAVPNYIEDVFSTWLYTGNGSTQTITNGIDLAGKGGLVWNQSRSNTYGGYIYDTARGTNSRLQPFSTAGQITTTQDVTAFNSNGFTMGSEVGINGGSGQTYVSWTFRKQPKFFDVVTYTGNGSTTGQMINHNLGSIPGTMIVKRTNSASGWSVWHTSLPTSYGRLDVTSAFTTSAAEVIFGNGTTTVSPTSTNFTVGTSSTVNASGGTYVAYLFAHNAGGFGLTGTDNVISCGSFTGNTTVNLGYEPQWVLVKNYAGADSWTIMDNMRGMANPGNDNALLRPNTSGAEGVGQGIFPTATGFTTTAYSGLDCIYIAIRRGPMKVPTDGTKVYYGYQPHSTGATIAVGFPSDFVLTKQYNGVSGWGAGDRLRGNDAYLIPNNTNAEASFANTWGFTQAQNSTNVNYNGANSISYFYRRAPGFFDEVCATAFTSNHNLGVVPELVIQKTRGTTDPWGVWVPSPTASLGALNSSAAFSTSWNGSATSTTFNAYYSGVPFVAYLFASAPGVSKVGTYTGNGTTQTINCGFTGGARFVLIKRTDATGDWVLWDSSRGMVAGTDPRLALNSTAAEVNANWVYTTTGGFQIVTSDATVNASGGSYIFLSIA